MFDFEDLIKNDMVGKPLKEVLAGPENMMLILARTEQGDITEENTILKIEKYISGDNVYYHVVGKAVHGFLPELDFVTGEAKKAHDALVNVLYDVFKKYKLIYDDVKWFHATRL